MKIQQNNIDYGYSPNFDRASFRNPPKTAWPAYAWIWNVNVTKEEIQNQLDFFWNNKAAAIPHNGMNLIGRPNAAGFALVAEGHNDGALQLVTGFIPTLCQSNIAIIEGKFPDTVQVAECITDKVRAGMFRTGNIQILHGSLLLLVAAFVT